MELSLFIKEHSFVATCKNFYNSINFTNERSKKRKRCVDIMLCFYEREREREREREGEREMGKRI